MSDRSAEATLEKSPEGMMIVGDDGVVVHANAAAGRLFGLDAPRLVGARFGFPLVSGGAAEIEIVCRDERRVAEMRAATIEWEGRPTRLATLRRGYERRRDEHAHGARRAGRPMGEMLAAISTGLVQLYRDSYGKGPTRAKTHLADDAVICLMGDCFTRVERTLLDHGGAELVASVRGATHDALRDRKTRLVEGILGRKVVASVSQIHVDPDMAVEVFVLDR